MQFAAFFISLCLVARFLLSGEGAAAACVSIVVKTIFLYAIMVTGCLWEKDVFGRYLFARSFFWEDVVSMAVLTLHTAYLAALLSHAVAIHSQMLIALAAYAAYVINATQFLVKFRSARRQGSPSRADLAAWAQAS
jgi:3-vinyl bacteriochlorophyllide hydratase